MDRFGETSFGLYKSANPPTRPSPWLRSAVVLDLRMVREKGMSGDNDDPSSSYSSVWSTIRGLRSIVDRSRGQKSEELRSRMSDSQDCQVGITKNCRGFLSPCLHSPIGLPISLLERLMAAYAGLSIRSNPTSAALNSSTWEVRGIASVLLQHDRAKI